MSKKLKFTIIFLYVTIESVYAHEVATQFIVSYVIHLN